MTNGEAGSQPLTSLLFLQVTMQDADEASMGGDAVCHVSLSDVRTSELSLQGGHARAATDEDGDEEMRGGQRVQCAQQ